jgi:hypothetical protein
MKKHLITAVICTLVGFGAGSVGVAFASTPKPSGYCTKAEIGKVRKYTTPSGKTSYNLKCKVVPTQKWQRA